MKPIYYVGFSLFLLLSILQLWTGVHPLLCLGFVGLAILQLVNGWKEKRKLLKKETFNKNNRDIEAFWN